MVTQQVKQLMGKSDTDPVTGQASFSPILAVPLFFGAGAEKTEGTAA
jgi:hypothetical protein